MGRLASARDIPGERADRALSERLMFGFDRRTDGERAAWRVYILAWVSENVGWMEENR